MKLLLSLVFLSLISELAHSDVVSGNELQSFCAGLNNDGTPKMGREADSLQCIFYLKGTFDTAKVLKKNFICDGNGVTFGQEVEIVKKWFGDHPEKLNLPGGALAIIAVQLALPCPK